MGVMRSTMRSVAYYLTRMVFFIGWTTESASIAALPRVCDQYCNNNECLVY